MAVTEQIGHDKRGNPVYRRNERARTSLLFDPKPPPNGDPETGEENITETEVKELQIDDELPEVAEAYIQWLTRDGAVISGTATARQVGGLGRLDAWYFLAPGAEASATAQNRQRPKGS